MNLWTLLAALFVGGAFVGGAPVVSANEAPMADAGLDQTVENGTTVYLDAGGSVDGDGSIDGVRWTITDSDGTTAAPSCDTCTETQFTPDRTGEYDATVTVTDDAGATRNDTLTVTVEPASGPSVSLSGPTRTTRAESTTFDVTATGDGAELDRLHWFRNDSQERTIDLSGDDDTVTLDRTFEDAGTYSLRATVEDQLGYADAATQSVRVVSESSGSGGNGGGGSGGGGGGSSTDFERCPDGGHPVYSDDGDHQTGCRETAFTTTNDRILDLGSGVNPDEVRWEDNDGTLHTMDRDTKDELAGDDGLLDIETMKEVGEEQKQDTNPDSEDKYSSPNSGSSNSQGGSDHTSRSDDSSHIPGDSSEPSEPCDQFPYLNSCEQSGPVFT